MKRFYNSNEGLFIKRYQESTSLGLPKDLQVLTFIGAIAALAVMTFIAVSIGQIFHAVPDAAGGLPIDDYASILAWPGRRAVRGMSKAKGLFDFGWLAW